GADACGSPVSRDRPWAAGREQRPHPSRVPPPARFLGHARDADDILTLESQSQLGGIENPVDDIEAALEAIVDELRLALAVDEEQRRSLADREAGRKLDIGL